MSLQDWKEAAERLDNGKEGHGKTIQKKGQGLSPKLKTAKSKGQSLWTAKSALLGQRDRRRAKAHGDQSFLRAGFALPKNAFRASSIEKPLAAASEEYSFRCEGDILPARALPFEGFEMLCVSCGAQCLALMMPSLAKLERAPSCHMFDANGELARNSFLLPLAAWREVNRPSLSRVPNRKREGPKTRHP